MSKCKICKEEYKRERAGQTVCSYKCSIEYGKLLGSKMRKTKDKMARKDLKEYNDHDVSMLTKKATKAFNEFIRLRDIKLPCISCGHSGSRQWHAGHYQPAGGYSYLRYNELNVHKQCSICNNHKSGNLAEYRLALIEKIGLDQVELLEVPNQLKRWDAEELRNIIKEYRTKCVQIKDNISF